MIADFEKAVFARALEEQPGASRDEILELLSSEAQQLRGSACFRHLISLFAAVRHPMGYPTGATPEETARLNGQREVVAFLIRWSEHKTPPPDAS